MKKSIYLALAAAMLALLVMPIAFAGAAGNSGSTANASLKKQLKGLKQRIAALEGKPAPVIPAIPTTLPPSGPAGGDLTGAFPNPVLKPGAVDSNKLADGSVSAADMNLDSVGAYAFKGVFAVVGEGVALADEQPGTATVTCPAGQMLIAGGFAWNDKEQSTIVASAPSEANPNTGWVVEGIPHAGGNTLYAWATCMGA